MMELVYDVDFVFDCGFVQGVGSVDKFGYKYSVCGFFYIAMDYFKGIIVILDNRKFQLQLDFVIFNLMGLK